MTASDIQHAAIDGTLAPVRKIVHVDMDAFYASVEQRDTGNALRNRPPARPEAQACSRYRSAVAAV